MKGAVRGGRGVAARQLPPTLKLRSRAPQLTAFSSGKARFAAKGALVRGGGLEIGTAPTTYAVPY